jgi:hypothetical protein
MTKKYARVNVDALRAVFPEKKPSRIGEEKWKRIMDQIIFMAS